MKLTAGKRVIMFFHWLFSLLTCVAFAVYLFRPELIAGIYQGTIGGMTVTQRTVIEIAVVVACVVLTVLQAYLIFHRNKRSNRGFITVDSSETGRVRISVSAIEQMVRQSVTSIEGISEMKIGIENQEDSIRINIDASIFSGSHVPTITMNMQRAIRQFVEMNCGVAVREVSIAINSVSNTSEPRGRWGRGRHESPRAVPSQTAVDQSRPVESETGSDDQPEIAREVPAAQFAKPVDDVQNYYAAEPVVSESAPEVAQAPADDPAPVSEGEYTIPDEPRPIRLTLDYDADDHSEAPSGGDAD